MRSNRPYSQLKPVYPKALFVGSLLFNISMNDIIKSSRKFNFILYAHDTTLNSTVENFRNTTDEIQSSIISELQKNIQVARSQ